MKKVLAILAAAALALGLSVPALAFSGSILIQEPVAVDLETEDTAQLTAYLGEYAPGFDPQSCRVAYVLDTGEGSGRIHYRRFVGQFMTPYTLIVQCQNGQAVSFTGNLEVYTAPETMPEEAAAQNLAPYIWEARVAALSDAGVGAADGPWKKDSWVSGQTWEAWMTQDFVPTLAVSTAYADGWGSSFVPSVYELPLTGVNPLGVAEEARLWVDGAWIAVDWLRTAQTQYVKVRDLAQAGYSIGFTGSTASLTSPAAAGTVAAAEPATEAAPVVTSQPETAGAVSLPEIAPEVLTKARSAALVDFGFPQTAEGDPVYWLKEQTATPCVDGLGRAGVRVVSTYQNQENPAAEPVTAEFCYYADALMPQETAGTVWTVEEATLVVDGTTYPVNRILLDEVNYVDVRSLAAAGLSVAVFR